MEIYEISSLLILMVPRLHRCKGYIKRQLCAWRVQKCIVLVGADTVLITAWPQSTSFHGGLNRAPNGNMRNLALPIPMVPRLHQSNGYIKTRLRAWRVQKCISLVGSHSVITTAWKQSTPFHGGEYRAQNGNMRNCGRTNPHGTAFARMQWLYQKAATGLESSKMYCPSRCRYRTYHCVEAKYPVSWGVV